MIACQTARMGALMVRCVLVLLVTAECVLRDCGLGRLAVAARALPTPAEQGVKPPGDVPLATVSPFPHVPITGALHPPLVYAQTEGAPLSQIDQPASHALSTADAISILCVATIVPILGIAFILYPCFRDGILEWRLQWVQKRRNQQKADVDASRLKNVRGSDPGICDIEWAFISSPPNRESLLQDVWSRSDDAALRTQRRQLNDEKGSRLPVQVLLPETPITQSRPEIPSPLSPDFPWRSMFSYGETFRRLQPPTWRSHQPQNDVTSSEEHSEHVFEFGALEKEQAHDDPFKRFNSDVAYGRDQGVVSEKRRRQFYSVSSLAETSDGSKTPSPVWVRRRSVVVIESTKIDASSGSDTVADKSPLRMAAWKTDASGTDNLKTLCQRNRTSSVEKNDNTLTSSTESDNSGHVICVCAEVHEHGNSSSSGNSVDGVGATGPS
uniref:Membrane-associated protein n=1 Tax=Branchiostoma floridae TaxID=7739 RepID=C3XXX6_BRAFL|eukprot:XP_002611020.1 hypothetical protein BRAFLDRAFT_97503 [Branchiostoma floridae]